MRTPAVIFGCLVSALVGICLPGPHAPFFRTAAAPSSHSPQAASISPQYDSSGALLRPKDFETWIFVGASTGLSYEPGTSARGSGEFKNVYITREAYEAYRATGKFPDKTMLALAVYDPSEKVSPAKAGLFEGQFTSLAFAIKDHSHSPGGWSYYDFTSSSGHLADSAEPFPKSQCYDCHHQHATDDNVFVQFYPVLREIYDARRQSGSTSRR
jgi:hypothetical protein